jgi:hypothetical protein
MNTKKTSEKEKEEKVLTIHDYLKMIGMKELTANIYSIPSTRKSRVSVS